MSSLIGGLLSSWGSKVYGKDLGSIFGAEASSMGGSSSTGSSIANSAGTPQGSSMSHLVSTLTSGIGNLFSGGGTTTANQSAALADPFASQRGQYQGQLSTLWSDPSSIESMPGYQFNYNQGLQALQRQEAATGNLNSGTGDINAVQYGENYANNTFQTYEQMLAQLAGGNLTQGNAGSVYESGMQTSNSALGGLFGGLLNNLGGISNLFSSGSSGSGGGITPDLSGVDTSSGSYAFGAQL